MNFRKIGFRKTAVLVATGALLCGVFSAANAQQTIFNVPSADVLDKGKVYGELDVTFKPNNDSGNVLPGFHRLCRG